MKKRLKVMLAVACTVCLFGCGQNAGTTDNTGTEEAADATTEETAEATEETTEDSAEDTESANLVDGPDGNVDSVEVDLGTSELYSQEELEAAVELIKENFKEYKGCEMHSIRYAGDECNSEKNIKWMNELGEGENFVECAEFLSDFHSPVEGGGAWEADKEYKDYEWWLARTDGGEWELKTSGY